MSAELLKLTAYFGERLRGAHGFVADELLDLFGTEQVADSVAELGMDDPEIRAIADRFARHQTVRASSPLAARFTSLRDLAERPIASRMVTPPGSLSSIDTTD